jgi:hypothetical protein
MTMAPSRAAARRGRTDARFEPPSAPGTVTVPVRRINGVEVVEVQEIRLHPKAGALKVVRLIMADGTVLHGCRECDFSGSRGDVMAHRNAVHGARYGKKTPAAPGDVIVAQRENGFVPQAVQDMTIGELVAIMPTVKELGDLVERMDIERNEAVRALRDLEGQYHRNRVRIEGYDSMREELMELRSWKKKMVQRLAALGFKLEEDE